MEEINKNLSKQPNHINESYVGVYAYDIAIIKDLRARFNYTKDGKKKTNNIIQITNSENVFNIIGDIENDTIQFPIISLIRTGWQFTGSEPEFLNNSGGLVGYMEGEKGERIKQVRLQAFPIQINYQLDIWTQNRYDNDVIAREFCWFYKQNPQLRVFIPHGLNITEPFNLFIEPEVVDNSDIAEHNSRGRYYRQTIGLYVDDAYLWKSSVTNVPGIDIVKFSIYTGDISNIENKIEDDDGLISPELFNGVKANYPKKEL